MRPPDPRELDAAIHRPPVLVLGAYVNSLSVARELSPHGIEVWVLHYQRGPAHASRFVERSFVTPYLGDDALLLERLVEIGTTAPSRPVLIPTHDHHVLFMAQHEDELRRHYLMSLNGEAAKKIVSKRYQYELCEKAGVPFPRTVYCEGSDNIGTFLGDASALRYPVIVKPFSRASDCGSGEVFRLKVVSTPAALRSLMTIDARMAEGRLLASEIVPGSPDNIWAYTAFMPSPGHILAGWTGRKLSQRPPDFGVFASAETKMNATVEAHGRALLESSEHVGIGEPEFKYDSRDGQYKLMEINPRLMMWHMCGYLAGVNLPLMQYLYLVGDEHALASMQRRQDIESRRLAFIHHEFLNVTDQHNKPLYAKNLLRALLMRRKRFALFWREDSGPWVFHTLPSLKAYATTCRGAAGRRFRRLTGKRA